ncbi:MAG: hypothetical protein ACK5OB_10970 [Pirellula sp.]
MDWVKPKHRSRRLKPDENVEVESQSAIQWLENLCEENVALLQSSLPIEAPASGKRDSVDFPIARYLKAMLWGTAPWEVAKPSHREFLHDLVEAFGAVPFANTSAATKRSRKTKIVSPEIRAQQIAHATKIGKWITQQLPKSSYDPYVALTCAGWLHALPEVGRDIPPALWIEVLQSTLTQVDRAWAQGHEDGLFPWVIWACEVPLALANQLSQLGGKDRIVSETLNRIALLLEQTAEDPSPLLAFQAQDLRAFLACMVRSRWAANQVGARKWYPPQRKALAKLLSLALHLSDGEGHAMLALRDATSHDADFWSSAFEFCPGEKKALLAATVGLPDDVGKQFGFKPSKLRKDKTNDAVLPKPSVYWEKSNIACMRRTWRDRGSRAVVDFSSDVIWLDIADQHGRRLFSGDWDLQLHRNGGPVEIDVAWSEVCWFTDDDVDYLELECDLENTCTIQRQIMLMREEGIVMMADAVIAHPKTAKDSQWSLKSSWQLDASVALAPQQKSTEAFLERTVDDGASKGPIPAALLLPVALPEWRRAASNGALTGSGNRIALEANSDQCRVYNPLIVALRGVQNSSQYTWRHLSVAQDLHLVPKETAQAYRVQIGKEQWVFYRSLTACTRRTVMGLHLNTEFYAARFQARDGSYEPLIEVNPA